jgi:uncharacterized protein YcbX
MIFFILSSFLFLLIVNYLLKEQKVKKSFSKSINNNVSVTDLYIYPIKSCKGIKVTSAKITKRGFLYDRMFVIAECTSKGNRFITQRNYPPLALVECNLSEMNNNITISAPNMPSITISLTETKPDISLVTIWSDVCECQEVQGVNDDVAEWFNRYLNMTNLKLFRMSDKFERQTDREFSISGQTGFADGYPFLIASNQSLQAVNEKLSQSIDIINFRPNIIVNTENPFDEDTWKEIYINNVKFSVVKPCSRCKLPNVIPDKGIMDTAYPVSEALKQFRTGKHLQLRESWKNEVFFGQNLDHHNADKGSMSVGDKVQVIL